MKTLHLTSPLMHGSDVKTAQLHLAANVFGQNFQPGKADGDFGESTARACIRAKFWLGYPQREQVGTYGDELEAYLTGTKLPTAFKLRRSARVKKSTQVPLREKALASLRLHLGEKESPAGSNKIAFASLWYGVIGPWCAMAVSRAYVEAGSKAFVKGSRYAYVPYIVHDARAGANGLAITQEPKPGDIVCYDWDGDGVADHTGLFDHWSAGNDFVAVEGNTARGNDSNGGAVMERARHRSNVQAFVHVGR